MISTSDNINRSIDVIAVNTEKKNPQYFELNYAIYIIMAKNGMSPLRVLIQPYPLPSSLLFGRAALLAHVVCDWRFLQLLQLCQSSLMLFGQQHWPDSLGAGELQAPQLSKACRRHEGGW